jgi:bifunctional UDP-N-acetylglucosamine pyrophosphorylase/glucosamine-1-phosphate N-acetyltransferase
MNGMALILAAGEGKRMKSDLPKVLHEALGEPLLAHVARAAKECGLERVVVVVGSGSERVRARFTGQDWEFVEQPQRLGTGDAVRRARSLIDLAGGDVVVLAGDAPLIRGRTLATLRDRHRGANASATVLTAELPDPKGYGRILRDEKGTFTGIVEEKDATAEQRAVREVNSSVYCFAAKDLGPALDEITNDTISPTQWRSFAGKERSCKRCAPPRRKRF